MTILPLAKNNLLTKWEVDLGTTFSESQWLQAIPAAYSITHCVTHWKLTLKINVRWYLTPFKLAKLYPGSSALCWRGCGGTGG